jgi:hypothetical protein
MDNERRGRFTGIYLRMDGIRRTLALRLAHYGDAGALSEDQIGIMAERRDLDQPLAKDLSVLLGYALDVDSEVGLVRVTPVKPRNKSRQDARRLQGHCCRQRRGRGRGRALRQEAIAGRSPAHRN